MPAVDRNRQGRQEERERKKTDGGTPAPVVSVIIPVYNGERFLSQAVAKYHEMAIALSDDLAAHPELPDQEFRSSQKMVEILQQAGYEMEYPYLGWPTAFRGVLDNGEGPNVAIMVEYDALPGLGHACGHNVHGSMAILTALALAECKDQYQGKVYVFGSCARKEETPESDVDVLVELNLGASLFDLMDLQDSLETLLQCKVDVVSKRGLNPYIKKQVLQEAIAL